MTTRSQRADHSDERIGIGSAPLFPRVRAHEPGTAMPLAHVRRVEQHQQTMVNWLLPADLSSLETTIAFDQVAIEVTAIVAQHEPDPYVSGLSLQFAGKFLTFVLLFPPL